MKKIISIIISLVFVLSMIAPMATNVGAADLMDWYDLQPEGSIVYTPNFNGDAGVYEPGYLSGDPVVTVDPADSNKITMTSGTNKSKSYWGGFIETLPLNEYTCYTIYFTVTRNTDSAIGVYCDSVYGMYGYPAKTKLMRQGSDMPGGHAYQNYTDLGYEVPILVEGTDCVQEFAMEVNGVETTIGYFIKDNAGEWKKMDYANPGDIEFFNADVLGLFFYVYYNTQVSTVSNCYITKGLSFSEVVYPERTKAPETTPAPETTAAPETTKAEETTAEATEAPENNEGEATQAPTPSNTKAPEKTEEKKGGCGGFVAGGVALVALLGTAIIVKKRD